MGGKHSRDKGKAFERLVADAYRQLWPDATVRRVLQAHKAYESDVTVEGHEVGRKLWTECNHADAPNPLNKLQQAERDIHGTDVMYSSDRTVSLPRYPVVVWRKSGAQVIYVTTRLWVLAELSGQPCMPGWRSLVVTIGFNEWLSSLKMLDA